MDRSIQFVLVGFLAVVFGLSALSHRFPHLTWLRRFRYDPPPLSEEHKRRMRQRASIYAGVELILMGLALPLIYAALTLMFFNEFTTTKTALVVTGSIVCIGLGATAIWRNRRG
jgi:hypothetical protein